MLENEWAFDLLYCVAFAVMDKQWLDRNATYMEFNVSCGSIMIHTYYACDGDDKIDGWMV